MVFIIFYTYSSDVWGIRYNGQLKPLLTKHKG